jgi:UDP-N-acetylglucosamine transferase subunit ALG13
VFATVGTDAVYPFNRLVRSLRTVARIRPVVIQYGVASERPEGARLIDFLPFDQLDRYIGEADVVVTHGGIGSVLLALSHGKHPIVMPRRHALGESVDDHQVAFAQRLAEIGLATVVSTEGELSDAVAASIHEPEAILHSGQSLSEELAALLEKRLPPYAQSSPKVASERLKPGQVRPSLNEDEIRDVVRQDSFRARTEQGELVSFEVELLDRQQGSALHEEAYVVEMVKVAESVSDGHIRMTLFDFDKNTRPL